jgi:hypothetical protein
VASQDRTLELALRVLETSPGPRTTVVTPLVWPGPAGWRRDYLNLAALTPRDIAQRRAENEQAREIAQGLREAALKGDQAAK